MSVLTLENILSALEGVRQTGTDRWTARCPAHGDRKPSLSIKEVGGGKVLLYCFTGCQYQDIMGAIRERLGLPAGQPAPQRSPLSRKVDTPRPAPLPKHNQKLSALFTLFLEACDGSPAAAYMKSRGIEMGEGIRGPLVGYAAPGKWPGRPWEGGRAVFPHQVPDPLEPWNWNRCNLYGRAIPIDGRDAPPELRHDHLPGPKGIYNAHALQHPQVVITEGVFDALSFSMSGYEAIAVFGTSGFQSIWPALPYTPIVVIVADNVEAGKRAAMQAWRGLALGKAVYVERPPADCKDWNEALVKHGMIHLPIYRPPKRYTLLRRHPGRYENWELADEEIMLDLGADGKWHDKSGKIATDWEVDCLPARWRGKDHETLFNMLSEPLESYLVSRDGIVETWECVEY
jgi:hypothetical protein